MVDKIKLYKNIEAFIDNKCTYTKNEPFKINFFQGNEKTNNLPIIFDKNSYIQCFLKIPKKEESIINGKKNAVKIIIKESSFELVLYKSDDNQSIIKCLIIIIIEDIQSTEESSINFNESAININDDFKLMEKLKIFFFDYIKMNKNFFPKEVIHEKTNILEKILLKDAKDDIRFFNEENKGINTNENIKPEITKIKSVLSKLEIKQKEAGKEGKNFKNKNVIIDVLEELNPNFKTDLIDKYLDEMPEELNDLMKKFNCVKFNNQMYKNYLKNKEKEKEMEKEKEKQNKDENLKEDKKITDKKDKDNRNRSNKKSNNKKEKKKNENNLGSSSKKQLFTIKSP